MSNLNLPKTRDAIQAFELTSLFIDELGWNYPSSTQSFPVSVNETDYQAQPIATLGGVIVFEISGKIFPTATIRAEIHQQISARHYENLLIFIDKRPTPTKSIWYWLKQSPNQTALLRQHYYFRGQPGDLFISKLAALFVDMAELEKNDGELSVVQISENFNKHWTSKPLPKSFTKISNNNTSLF